MEKNIHFVLLLHIIIALSIINEAESAWGMGNEKKVLLNDVKVLTLYNEKMTKGRRSSPVPQLECVSGGSAPCSGFTPRVVQCESKGSDGYDVQWECKTDMDNTFRFGSIDVSCEGYDYADDPYVLHGSCGLRYSIDYTKEGMNQKSQHNYYGDSGSSYHSSSYQQKKSATSGMFADIIVYIVLGIMIYAFYVTCIRSGRNVDEQRDAQSNTNDDHPSTGGSGGYGWFGGGGNHQSAPRYNSSRDDASCGNNRNRNNATGGAGGFWTGAAAGGLLGYMFGGNRNNYGYGGGTAYRRSPYGGGGGFFSSGSGSGGGFSSSSGTRSASGFGGTSRR